jgi:hypothetical protein
VILMYCYTAAVVRPVALADLEFALSPAVNLAATGRAIKDRRIGECPYPTTVICI